MASTSFFQSLTEALSADSKVLTDETSSEFQASMTRWTSIDLLVPSAIVQPATEADVVTTVKQLVSASIPFVPASGGHSTFSSIGKPGVIIDLSRFTGVEVDVPNGVATVKGGTLMKEFQTALHRHEHFAAIGSGNTVGVIPYYTGGGISAYSPFCGYGCENIVAVRLITAAGALVDVSSAASDGDSDGDNAELLWGVRGAGQFLGLVTQITVRILPYAALGNATAQRITGTFAFTVDKLDAVAAVMGPLMAQKEIVTAGHFMVSQAPPDLALQVLLVAPQIFAPAHVAEALLKPLVDLGPILQVMAPSTFATHSDQVEYLCAKGGFKRFTQNGMSGGFRVESFRELVKLHAETVATCPDAARSAFTVEWHTPYKGSRPDTAFGLGEVEYWLNFLSWYEDPQHHEYLQSIDKKGQEIGRAGEKEEDFISYTNTCRDAPLAWRYKGHDRIERLKSLKKKWDPTGVFTTELL